MSESLPVTPHPSHYVGVKTTKIYCFPWCKAPQPNPENVTLYATREEAERAGLRPCRTCYSGLPVDCWEDHKTHIALHTPPEFSFDEVLVYLTRSSEEVLYRVADRKVYKLLLIQDAPVLIRLESPSPGSLHVHFDDQDELPKKSVRVEAARHVWDWFDLGRDLKPFYQMAEHDPLLQGIVSKYHCLRIVGEVELFDALCWAITGQQITLTFAYTLKRRFVETFGTSVQIKGQTYWLFPSPSTIANLSVEDLIALKFTQRKSEYLIDIARRVSTGELTKQKLLAIDDFHAVVKTLTAIRGIGNWTANYVVMRCLRMPSAFPIEDVGLQNAVKQALGMDRKPTLDELREMALPWRGWEAYATFYLWRSLQG